LGRGQRIAMPKTNASVGIGVAVLCVLLGCGGDDDNGQSAGGDASMAEEEEAGQAAGTMTAASVTTPGMTTPATRDVDVPAPAPLNGAAPSFSEVQTIIEARCATIAGCHADQAPGAGLDLKTDAYGALTGGTSATTGKALVVKGSAQQSYLYEKVVVEQPSAGSRMPLGQDTLSESEITTIAHWIEGGANEE